MRFKPFNIILRGIVNGENYDVLVGAGIMILYNMSTKSRVEIPDKFPNSTV